MKKINYLLVLALLGFASCKKSVLDLYPYNQIETSLAFNTEADITLAVDGIYAGIRTSGSYYSGTWNIFADQAADNLISNKSGPGRGTGLTYSEWRYTANGTYGLFSGGYTIIRRANAILENIDKFADGAFKNNAKGQALAMRAMVHFDMSRVYSKTYENATASDSTVPYVTSTDHTLKPAKEDLKGFYDKIIADLELAKTLIGTNDVYHLGKASVNGLLSRVYLYKGDFPNCITSANEAIGLKNSTIIDDIMTFPSIWKDSTTTGVLFKIRNTATDNDNTLGVNYYQSVGGEKKSEYVVEYNFRQQFEKNDIRDSIYIEASNFNGQKFNNVIKYRGRSGDPAGVLDAKVIRSAEVLLSRAESYYRSGNEADALANLVLLKKNRYKVYTEETATELSGSTLLEEIYKQRRLELAFEGDRFFDLKRRNLPIERDGTKGDLADGTGIPYVFLSLPAGDYKFQLPFPSSEINFNENLKQNPGYN